VRTRRRIPIAYAGLLIVTLVAAIGAAAFSAGRDPAPTTTVAAEPAVTLGTTLPISARVASAVFAVSVTPRPEIGTTTTTSTEAELQFTEATAAPPALQVEPSTTTTTTGAPETQAAPPPPTTPRDTTPPKLTVTEPGDGDVVTTSIVTFRGTTEPGARVFSGPYEATVDEKGHWSLKLVVAPGPNGAVFSAEDAAGNETSIRIVVHYEPPTTTTTKPKSTTTTKPKSTTTTKPASTTTTTAPSWSPQWPADPAGIRDVENWRDVVTQYWDADKVDCALGIMRRESRGDPQAHNSSTNAVGLFQHLLKYWPGRARAAGFVDGDGLVASPYNGEANIAASAWLANYYESRGYPWWTPWSTLYPYGSCQP